MAALPFRLAVQSGVAPRSLAAFTLAPGANQQVGAFDIVAIAGPVQRGRAVRFGGVDVGLFLEQRAHRLAIGGLGRVDERHVSSTPPQEL